MGDISKKSLLDTKDSNILIVAELSQNKPYKFSLNWESPELNAYLTPMDLRSLSKVTIIGQIKAEGGKNWYLTAKVGATAVQSCVITVEDIKTRLDVNISRRYFADFESYEATLTSEEVLDDEAEAIPEKIDILKLALETISIGLDDFPRKEGAALEPVLSAPKGVAPLTDDAIKPFAGLASFRDKLKG